MGLPIWKPRRKSLDEIQDDSRKRDSSIYERHIRHSSSIDSEPVSTRHSSNRRQTQESSRLSSTPRNELERIEQFIMEKKNLLEQLQVTGFLLEQFLTTRTRLGTDAVNLPDFITQDLPSILESAAALAALSPAELISPFPSSELGNDEHSQLMVEALLSTPPYSTQIQEAESSILSAHRRIRRQLRSLAISRQNRRSSQVSSSHSLPSRTSPPFHPSSAFRSPSTRLTRRIRFVDRDASP